MMEQEASYYSLRPARPGRAILILILALVVGGGLLAAGIVSSSIALIVVGVILLVFAVVLAVLTMTFMSARTVEVELSDEGFEVRGPGYRRSADWSEVTAINATPDGSRLVIACGRVTRVFIQSPQGSSDELIQHLTDDMVGRLQRYVSRA